MSLHELFNNVRMVIEDAYAQQASADTTWVDPFSEGFYRTAYLVYAGTIGTSIAAVVQQATDSSGTGAKGITDKDSTALGITTLVTADVASNNVIATVELGPGALDDKNGFDHIRLSVTATGTCDWGVFRIDYKARHKHDFTFDDTFLAAKSATLFMTGGTVTTLA